MQQLLGGRRPQKKPSGGASFAILCITVLYSAQYCRFKTGKCITVLYSVKYYRYKLAIALLITRTAGATGPLVLESGSCDFFLFTHAPSERSVGLQMDFFFSSSSSSSSSTPPELCFS